MVAISVLGSAALLCVLAVKAAAQQPNISFPTVTAQGTLFAAGGKTIYAAGTNLYTLADTSTILDEEVCAFFQVLGSHRATVVRIFAFINGYGGMLGGQLVDATPAPIQPALGVYYEPGLQRLDLILAQARRHNIRVIMVLSNFWGAFGGMQWYVDQAVGMDQPLELFYSDERCRQAFKGYLAKIIGRVNTINGIPYASDGAVFSWELANEPQSRVYYELNMSLPAGSLVTGWLQEMSAYVKSLDAVHMVSSGEIGYRLSAPDTADLSTINATLDEQLEIMINWPYKGEDFASNVLIDTLDFMTIHSYPDQWGVAPSQLGWLQRHFYADRAALVHAANKPLIIEEYGAREHWADRDMALASMHAGANALGLAGTLCWQLFASPPASSGDGYNFCFDEPGAHAMLQQFRFLASKGAAASV
ncbi:hypothetical protein WJX81_003563 [Elliptochloris bilobata]|uniref:mannan endo-1,4-beta-mannosidase n=1 Tax=Elliptochloris bilobata TaxID=381761 RepID=A0AAW1RLB2_9CHLO